MACPESRTPPDPRGKDAIPEKHQGHSDKPACRVWPWRFSSRPARIQSLGKLPRISWDFHPDRDQTCPRLRLIHCTLPFGRCSLTPELSRTARHETQTAVPPRSGFGSNELLDLNFKGREMKTEVRAERLHYTNNIDLVVAQRSDDGTVAVALPLVFQRLEIGAYVGEPTIRLELESAQLLMDELWRCGLRPSEGTGSAGSLAATERHLKDMRDVAMGLLRKTGVQV